MKKKLIIATSLFSIIVFASNKAILEKRDFKSKKEIENENSKTKKKDGKKKNLVCKVEETKVLNTSKKNVVQSEVKGKAITRYSSMQEITTTKTDNGFILEKSLQFDKKLKAVLPKGLNFFEEVELVDNDNIWDAQYNDDMGTNGLLDAYVNLDKVYSFFASKNPTEVQKQIPSVLKVKFINNYRYRNNASAQNINTPNDTFIQLGRGERATNRPDVFSCLDIMAHEFAHIYYKYPSGGAFGESGAIVEAFADIVAVGVERFYKPNTTNNWMLGEEVSVGVADSDMVNIANPNSSGFPTTYGGNFYVAKNDSSNQEGGAHANSAIISHLFYMLSEGKSGVNEYGITYNVRAEGFNKTFDYFFSLGTVVKILNLSDFKRLRSYMLTRNSNNAEDKKNMIEAWKAIGFGNESDSTAPTAPTALQVTSVPNNFTSVDLKWESSANDVNKFAVILNNKVLGFVNGKSARINNLLPGKKNNIMIRAIDAAGNISESSNIVSHPTTINGIPDTTGPSAPNLSVQLMQNSSHKYGDQLMLRWAKSTDNARVANYIVGIAEYRIDNNGNEVSVDTFQATVKPTTSFSNELFYFKPVKDKKYAIRIFAVDDMGNKTGGNSVYWPAKAQTPPAPSNKPESIEDELVNIKVFPNPTHDYVNLDGLKNDVNYTFAVYNLHQNKIIKSGKLNSNSIDVSNIPSGDYMLELNNGKNIIRKRFLKQE